jgi:hypothetical protein
VKLTALALRMARPPMVELDKNAIQKWRKDLLLFLRNIGTLARLHRSYDAADNWRATGPEKEEIERLKEKRDQAYDEFRKIANVLSKRFERFFFKGLIEKGIRENGLELPSDFVGYWDRTLSQALWPVVTELLNIANPWRTKGKKLELELQGDRVKRAMRIAWKALDDFLRWHQAKGRTVQVQTDRADVVEIEGFSVKIVGYDAEDAHHQKTLGVLKQALKLYKQRAARAYPTLLKHQLPFVLSYAHGSSDFAGRYSGRYIMLNVPRLTKPQETVKVLAHEMAHHIFHMLSGQARKFWDATVRANYAPIDLQAILDRMPPSMKFLSQLGSEVEKSDPELSIQLDILSWPYGPNRNSGISTREDLEDTIASGKKVWVPKNPITHYASKNPNEAFCEALGLLVAYGPKTVHPLVRKWLKTTLPDLRSASIKPMKKTAC